ncbi:MAG: ATP-binding cassette domain-containing protein, partial [Chlorobiaceae bacterium]|nr:ATP-binding cassette domain-containing protein [Chlorobiaceae bacterium]
MPMLLELRDVNFAYAGAVPGRQSLLEGLCLSVQKGDFMVIRGASGSGKSTILRLVCRFHSPQSGSILFRGEPVGSIKPSNLRASICYVAQIPVMVDGSVADNLLLPFSFDANHDRQPPSSDKLDAMLAQFYLQDVSLSQPAQKLSVGQKQRLALMRTLLTGPEILLLDEPTSALDKESAAMVFSIIERLNAEEGKTVITVTHSDYLPSVPNPKSFVLRN